MPEIGIQNTIQRKLGIFFLTWNFCTLRMEVNKEENTVTEGCLGFSQPHVLEEAAVLRALAALWGTGCCCPGVCVPTL